MKNRLLRRLIPDETYMAWQYQQCLNKPLNLQNPQTFNEKIQWIKLNWRVDILTRCADKYEVRGFVQSRIGGDTLKALYGVYQNPDEINPDTLPDRFMLKVNHGCSQNIPCRNKSEMDWNKTRRQLRQFLKSNLFQHGREWSYKNIPPRILCEEYLEGHPLMDYNIFCFDGVPRFVEVIADRMGSPRVNMFDLDWNPLQRIYATPPLGELFRRPSNFDQILKDAAALAQGFPFVRVDFFDDGRKIFFGELTFYPYNGLNPFKPETFDAFLGSFLKLPPKVSRS
ncbi:MAG: ATP-grasp fold amidoligase family protein [Verrucomicrobiota bacterium]